MSFDVKNKRICTLIRVFAILITAFSGSYLCENQVFAQTDEEWGSEVIEAYWELEEASEILDQLSPTIIAEFDISSKWSDVEVLDENLFWENYTPDDQNESQFISESFSVNRPEWRVVIGQHSNSYLAQVRLPAFRNNNGQIQRLGSWSGVIAQSPANHNRIQRDWPENSALSTGNWIKFATTKDINTLEEAMQNADVFIGLSKGDIVSPEMLLSMTKDFEGFGLTIAEAMLVKTPVLATRVGGVGLNLT